MYYCSKNSKEKIAHTESCRYAKRMQPRNTIMYKNAIEHVLANFKIIAEIYCAPDLIYVKYISSKIQNNAEIY